MTELVKAICENPVLSGYSLFCLGMGVGALVTIIVIRREG
jgi:hypothetical protein